MDMGQGVPMNIADCVFTKGKLSEIATIVNDASAGISKHDRSRKNDNINVSRL